MKMTLGEGKMFVGSFEHEGRVGVVIMPSDVQKRPGERNEEFCGEVSEANWIREDALYLYLDNLDSLAVLELHLAHAKEALLDKKLKEPE